jgi:hypothetical protein
MVSAEADLAAEAPEEAVSTVVEAAFAAVWGPDSLGADRASALEAFETSVGVAISVAIAGSVIGSCSSATSAFTIRFSTATILTGITHTAIILTDIILTAAVTGDMGTTTDTILTINPVTGAFRPGGVPQFGKSRGVWRVRAIIMARSTESWVLEHVMQCELTNARICASRRDNDAAAVH